MSFETVRHLFRARKLFRAIIVCVAWVDRPPVSRPKLSSAPAQVIIRCIKGWVEAQLAVNLPSAGKVVQQIRPRHCFQEPLSMDRACGEVPLHCVLISWRSNPVAVTVSYPGNQTNGLRNLLSLKFPPRGTRWLTGESESTAVAGMPNMYFMDHGCIASIIIKRFAIVPRIGDSIAQVWHQL